MENIQSTSDFLPLKLRKFLSSNGSYLTSEMLHVLYAA